MEAVFSYRQRTVSSDDVAFIRELIARHPSASRRALSVLLCEAWNWRQPNGAARDLVCRGLMLGLHRARLIELPPQVKLPPNPLARRAPPVRVEVSTDPLLGSLRECVPLEWRLVRRTADEALFNSLLEQHHYLGYTQPVGAHLKYLVLATGRPVACAAWSSAPRHLRPRDQFIGWSPEVRRRNLHGIAYNLRFLVLPWVRVPHLASHLLGAMARRISDDWVRAYGHPIHYLESFVDPQRFRGTCYQAANWIRLGPTQGRGKDAPTWEANRPVKQILGYPVHRHFRRCLGVT